MHIKTQKTIIKRARKTDGATSLFPPKEIQMYKLKRSKHLTNIADNNVQTCYWITVQHLERCTHSENIPFSAFYGKTNTHTQTEQFRVRFGEKSLANILHLTIINRLTDASRRCQHRSLVSCEKSRFISNKSSECIKSRIIITSNMFLDGLKTVISPPWLVMPSEKRLYPPARPTNSISAGTVISHTNQVEFCPDSWRQLIAHTPLSFIMCFYNPIHSCQLAHTRVFCGPLCGAHRLVCLYRPLSRNSRTCYDEWHSEAALRQ